MKLRKRKGRKEKNGKRSRFLLKKTRTVALFTNVLCEEKFVLPSLEKKEAWGMVKMLKNLRCFIFEDKPKCTVELKIEVSV